MEQLDTLPRQVLIEAKIYAVTLNDELSFGVSWFLQQRGTLTGPATTGSVSAPAGETSGGILSLTTKAIIGSDRELVATVNALRAKTDVEILDAPRVLALDGTPASINVGSEIPVTTASYGNPLQSGTTNFINTIQFRPTGTTLLIVPRISASGIVTMDTVVEVSNATGPALTPTIDRTYAQTSFIVGDGQTVAIAGLITDSYSLGKNRVPVLGDIPILGALFGTTERSVRRRELVIFITPKVVRNLPTAAELNSGIQAALRLAYGFIKAQEEAEQLTIDEHRLLGTRGRKTTDSVRLDSSLLVNRPRRRVLALLCSAQRTRRGTTDNLTRLVPPFLQIPEQIVRVRLLGLFSLHPAGNLVHIVVDYWDYELFPLPVL